jgi:hypothetical protein
MKIRFEGLTQNELLALAPEDFDELVLVGRPIVFRVGSAEVLGEFRRDAEVLSLDLAHIDGGGEGVIPALASVAERYARLRGLRTIEWLVRATNCARPNPKLRALLEHRGFLVRTIPERGEAYHLAQHVR